MHVKSKQSVLALKPTQFAIGLREIEARVDELHSMGKHALQKCLHKTVVPVIVAPWRDLYAVDHHHFLFSCWQAEISQVRVKVVNDYSRARMTYRQFWARLASNDHVRLYDQFGDGPRNPLYLPNDIRGLADDPYRSLAWAVRDREGFENTSIPFAEFLWADFFRDRRLLEKEGRRGMKAAIKLALGLARTRQAARLPGYRGSKASKAK